MQSNLTEQERLCNLETLEHIRYVQRLLNKFAVILINRGEVHDKSKLEFPEVSYFAEYTPKLAESTYNSPEYNGFKNAIKPALDHHYANNRHHPEHFPDGINGMNLADIFEMFCDWYAAGKRHNNGNMKYSISENKRRFNISDQLTKIFENTIDILE